MAEIFDYKELSMKIQPITNFCKPRPNFKGDNKRKNPDRAVTMQDLYDMEDRLNNKINKKNEVLGKALGLITDLIYYSPNMTYQDETDRKYYEAKYFTEKLKNV